MGSSDGAAPGPPGAGHGAGNGARTATWATPIDDGALAQKLGVSLDAVQLTRSIGVVDLHIEPFLTHRLWGTDLHERRGGISWAGRFFGHLDFPRMAEGGLAAGMWSITTHPFRSAGDRWLAFQENLSALRGLLADTGGAYRAVRNATEMKQALEAGAHAAIISVQGGNALQGAPDGPRSVPDNWLVRVTLVHLTNSVFGTTSSPLALWRRGQGLSPRGREFVEQLDSARVFVDLAHINPAGFWDAVAVHDRSLPLLVTHTGVQGVTPSWRNIDDEQIRAVADTGGTVGVIFADQFIRRRGSRTDGRLVVAHMKHIIDLVGDEFVSIGSDYDGAITPPADLRSGEAYPRLVQYMLDAGFTEARIERILRDNFLRTFQHLRG